MLTAEQQQALIQAADPATALLFLRGLELTGARPKELAAAVVADFGNQTARLSAVVN